MSGIAIYLYFSATFRAKATYIRVIMSRSITKTSLQQAAEAFYHWFHGAQPEPENFAIMQEAFGSPIEPEKLRELGERLRARPEFLEAQKPLVQKWRPRIESAQGLTDQEAGALIQELFTGFDHALLYDHDIRASYTRMRRGQISASETAIQDMPCWTLHLSLEGSALFINDNMEAEVLPGDMMLFRPDAHYHYGLHPRSDDWEHLWALFQPREHWAQLMQWRELDRGILVLSLPDEPSREHLEQLFRELIELGSEAGPMQSDLQYNKLKEILIRASAYSVPESAVAIDPRIQRACDYMRDRLAEKFSIDEVASACNLSNSRLAHLFKEQLGVAPKAWINDTRLQQARKLLINSGDSIGEIGVRVGFDDPSHFTRYFSKSLGCSPRAFRKSFRGA